MFQRLGLLLLLGLLLALASLSGTQAEADAPEPQVVGEVNALDVTVSARTEATITDDIYFLSTGLVPEMAGTQTGQIVLFAAEFCPGGVCATDELGLVRAFTEPFSDTVRVWVEHRAATEPIFVSFRSQKGYGLGQCEITPAGTARLWGWCEHDPIGDYAATQVLVHFPAHSTVGGLVTARPDGWKAPQYRVLLPFVQK